MRDGWLNLNKPEFNSRVFIPPHYGFQKIGFPVNLFFFWLKGFPVINRIKKNHFLLKE